MGGFPHWTGSIPKIASVSYAAFRAKTVFCPTTRVKSLSFQVNDFFNGIRLQLGQLSTKPVFYVGVHIRRGDMMQNRDLMVTGYTIAPASYVLNAMRYFVDKYPSYHVTFIVCTDDQNWYHSNIHGKTNHSVFPSQDNTAVVDLAILARCNATIVTVGTFGWWGAWLAGGPVVYYSDWPKPGSSLSDQFADNDYYPSHWMPMT